MLEIYISVAIPQGTNTVSEYYNLQVKKKVKRNYQNQWSRGKIPA
jgi:hypothetical protein